MKKIRTQKCLATFQKNYLATRDVSEISPIRKFYRPLKTVGRKIEKPTRHTNNLHERTTFLKLV